MHWVLITDPDGAIDPKQKTIFNASSVTYEQLFSSDVREPWKHFRSYILDTERRIAKEDFPHFIDRYFIAISNESVEGFAFATFYPQRQLAFLAYYGISDRNLIETERKELGRIFWTTLEKEANKYSILYTLLEVEKFNEGELWGDRSYINRRIEMIKSYQKHGTRKIPWIDYRQPILQVGGMAEPVSMYLMFRPFLGTKKATKTLNKALIKSWVEFVYKEFYLDGFRVTDKKKLMEINEHLDILYKQAIEPLPKSIDEIPVHEISFRRLGSVFISYSGGDQGNERIVRLLNECLEDQGIRVFSWYKNKASYASKTLKDAEVGWIIESDLVIFIISPLFIKSFGMKEEIDLAKKYKKPMLSIVHGDFRKKEWIESESRILREFGATTIYLKIEGNNFSPAINKIIEIVKVQK